MPSRERRLPARGPGRTVSVITVNETEPARDIPDAVGRPGECLPPPRARDSPPGCDRARPEPTAGRRCRCVPGQPERPGVVPMARRAAGTSPGTHHEAASRRRRLRRISTMVSTRERLRRFRRRCRLPPRRVRGRARNPRGYTGAPTTNSTPTRPVLAFAMVGQARRWRTSTGIARRARAARPLRGAGRPWDHAGLRASGWTGTSLAFLEARRSRSWPRLSDPRSGGGHPQPAARHVQPRG